jgi:hypothetical protein
VNALHGNKACALLPGLSKRVTVEVTGVAVAPSRRPSYQTRNAKMTVRLQAMIRHASILEKRERAQANVRHWALSSVDARQTRPRLANVAVPLGITAAIVSEQWWAMLPLGVCAWWWAPRDSGWEWAVAIGRGLVTAEWALVGAYALGDFAAERAVVGMIWAGIPTMLAVYKRLVQ